MFVKNFLISSEDPIVPAGSAFFTVYFSLLLHVTNLALNDTQGIIGSKQVGKRDYQTVFTTLKQSIIVGFIMLLIFCYLPALFYSSLLESYFQIDSELARMSQRMVVWALPAMAIRTLNDCLKTFLQNYECSKDLGKKYVVLITICIILSGVSIYVLKLGESSLGIILFIFEFSGVLICIYEFQKLKKREEWEDLDYSLKGASKDIKHFLVEFIDYYVMDAPPYFMFEVSNFIISLTYSNEQIAIYTLNSTLIFVIYSFSVGFTILARTSMNQEMGKKNFKNVIRYLKGFKTFFLILAAILSALNFAVFWILIKTGFYGEEGNYTRETIYYLNFLWIIRIFTPTYNSFVNNAVKSARMTNIGKYLYTYPRFLGPLICYLLCLYFGFGVLGLVSAEGINSINICWTLNSYLDEEIYLEKAKKAVGFKVKEGEKGED